MKKLLFIIPLFTGCASIKYVPLQKMNIIGNPRITCFQDNKVIADGRFVCWKSSSSILVDEWGVDYKVVQNPNCELNRND